VRGLLVLRRYGYGPPPVHYVGKAATFILLFALPTLLLLKVSPGTEWWTYPAGWSLAWWGLVLYWIAASSMSCRWSGVVRGNRYSDVAEKGADARLIPEELRTRPSTSGYAPAARARGVGITDYAQDQLGDIVYVQLPEPGTSVEAGQSMGEVESTKSVSEIYAPVSAPSAPATTSSATSLNSSTPTRMGPAGWWRSS
jgi:hypothetical protein